MPSSPRPILTTIAAVALVAALSGCASSPETEHGDHASGDAYPVTVTNCSNEITFDQSPERIVVLRNEVIPVLSSLGVLDRTVGLVGRFHDAYFDQQTQTTMSEIPVLSDEISQVGGGEISLEDVIAQEPDLVIGTSETITRDGLLAQGINVLENEESCAGSQATSTLDDIDTLFTLYADVFDRHDEADAALVDIDQRIDAAIAQIPDGENRTAAMLYPTIGGGATYAYGSGSMNHTLLELAGFTNVFADPPDRNAEVTAEELLARDPEVIILLHSGTTDEEVEESLTSLPGAGELNAVKNDALFPLLFGFTSPASPITIDGLTQIVERFQE
ncbi:ABC transporter substrate-binding protein [Microbacterium marinilacus]|uniref:ABC transporter substrate-binding protein n=1 Tax=Microbacterium marinilacus TaxID=415209 RepID=A0ABP7BJL8_9MICO|nr:ABC transporter substrate-binding protein [Microbacterium marinilacus]MBY0687617.1 ABC transporter substrate-binding protein [Microbacterium marinilacus]